MSTSLATYQRELGLAKPALAELLPPGFPADKLVRTVLFSMERNPALRECGVPSILVAATSAAVLGLPVDGVTGQAFIIPFKHRAQLVIGYKGFQTLADRSGLVITGEVVREGDPFDWQLGSDAYVHHKPVLGSDKQIVAAWATAQAKDRPPICTVIARAELDEIRRRAPGARKQDSPWNDPLIGYPAMAAKTAKRRLARHMPLNLETTPYVRAARMDEAVEEERKRAWITPDGNVVVEDDEKTGPVELAPQLAPTLPPPPPDQMPFGAPKPQTGDEALIEALDYPPARARLREALTALREARNAEAVREARGAFARFQAWLDARPIYGAQAALLEAEFKRAERAHGIRDEETWGP